MKRDMSTGSFRSIDSSQFKGSFKNGPAKKTIVRAPSITSNTSRSSGYGYKKQNSILSDKKINLGNMYDAKRALVQQQNAGVVKSKAILFKLESGSKTKPMGVPKFCTQCGWNFVEN